MSTTTPTPNPLATNPESQGVLWVCVTLPLLALTTAVVAVRVWWRRKIAGATTAADALVLISLACATIQAILGCIAILKWGLGHHAAYLGPRRVQGAMMYFYIYQIWYKILVGTTKMSFIYLYLDLFPIKSFRVVCHVLNVSIIMAIIAYTIATIFQCTPVHYYWNRTIKGGHCIASGPFWYGHAAWNSVMDVIVLLLPIPVIRSLQMGRSQKLAVFGVFSMGAFVIVASIMRMISLNPASKTVAMDPTYVISTSNAFLWTQVESCVAIICICLPTLKGPLGRIFPRIFGSTTAAHTSKHTYSLDRVEKNKSASQKKSFWGQDDTLFTNKGNSPSKPDWDETSSQERIIGVTTTVDVEITRANSRDEETGHTTAGQEMFRMGQK